MQPKSEPLKEEMCFLYECFAKLNPDVILRVSCLGYQTSFIGSPLPYYLIVSEAFHTQKKQTWNKFFERNTVA